MFGTATLGSEIPGLGTLVNAVAIVVGGLIGIHASRYLTERRRDAIAHALALVVLIIGVQMALKCDRVLVVLISMLCVRLRANGWISNHGWRESPSRTQRMVRSADNGFVEGFVSASLAFCVGSMAVLGALEDGIHHDPSLLYVKAMIDGVMSAGFATMMELGFVFPRSRS